MTNNAWKALVCRTAEVLGDRGKLYDYRTTVISSIRVQILHLAFVQYSSRDASNGRSSPHYIVFFAGVSHAECCRATKDLLYSYEYPNDIFHSVSSEPLVPISSSLLLLLLPRPNRPKEDSLKLIHLSHAISSTPWSPRRPICSGGFVPKCCEGEDANNGYVHGDP